MPDIKYSNNETAARLSGIKNYWDVVQSAVKEMHRQVGDLHINRRGIAKRGLLIRHLVLPNNLAGSKKLLILLQMKYQKTLILILWISIIRRTRQIV
jgi:putative pyruvate formate lyase activating enzyme